MSTDHNILTSTLLQNTFNGAKPIITVKKRNALASGEELVAYSNSITYPLKTKEYMVSNYSSNVPAT